MFRGSSSGGADGGSLCTRDNSTSFTEPTRSFSSFKRLPIWSNTSFITSSRCTNVPNMSPLTWSSLRSWNTDGMEYLAASCISRFFVALHTQTATSSPTSSTPSCLPTKKPKRCAVPSSEVKNQIRRWTVMRNRMHVAGYTLRCFYCYVVWF